MKMYYDSETLSFHTIITLKRYLSLSIGQEALHRSASHYLSFILQYIHPARVLMSVATIPGPTILAGFTLPY